MFLDTTFFLQYLGVTVFNFGKKKSEEQSWFFARNFEVADLCSMHVISIL